MINRLENQQSTGERREGNESQQPKERSTPEFCQSHHVITISRTAKNLTWCSFKGLKDNVFKEIELTKSNIFWQPAMLKLQIHLTIYGQMQISSCRNELICHIL